MEYAFFDEALRDRFISMATGMGISSKVWDDKIEGSVVELEGELDEEQMLALEAEYENLLDEQMVLSEADGSMEHQAMGINVTFADGHTGVVRLKGGIARRLMENFAAEEIHDLVQSIADSIEHPINGPLCKRA
ncbi:MAG TPA: hypothetical protein VFR06_08275 [Gallionellaceae bacterium]|nr:hypothetical protein [Gallionellaceae bacterium]